MVAGQWGGTVGTPLRDIKEFKMTKANMEKTKKSYLKPIFYTAALLYISFGLFGSLQIFLSSVVWWVYVLAWINLIGVIAVGSVGTWLFYNEIDPYRKYRCKFSKEIAAILNSEEGKKVVAANLGSVEFKEPE